MSVISEPEWFTGETAHQRGCDWKNKRGETPDATFYDSGETMRQAVTSERLQLTAVQFKELNSDYEGETIRFVQVRMDL